MPIVLISGTSSAFARMNRIALMEKNIPFELLTDVPWKSASMTPEYNPLEKLPILILEDGHVAYDSAHIQEYILEKFAHKLPKLLPEGVDAGLEAKQIQTLAEGHMDAIVLSQLEMDREHPDQDWQARQNRKIDGGMLAYSRYAEAVAARKQKWLVQDTYSIADIAVGCALGLVEFFDVRPGWKTLHPELAAYWEILSSRDSFKSTPLYMSD